MSICVCLLKWAILCNYTYFFFLEDLYCLSRMNLNNLVFIITRQLVNRTPEPTLLPTQGIFNLPQHRHGMKATGL